MKKKGRIRRFFRGIGDFFAAALEAIIEIFD